jgi:hypothetical protein
MREKARMVQARTKGNQQFIMAKNGPNGNFLFKDWWMEIVVYALRCSRILVRNASRKHCEPKGARWLRLDTIEQLHRASLFPIAYPISEAGKNCRLRKIRRSWRHPLVLSPLVKRFFFQNGR